MATGNGNKRDMTETGGAEKVPPVGIKFTVHASSAGVLIYECSEVFYLMLLINSYLYRWGSE